MPRRRFGVVATVVALVAAWIPVALFTGVAAAAPVISPSITVVLDVVPDQAGTVNFSLFEPDSGDGGSPSLEDDGDESDGTVRSETIEDLTPGDYQLVSFGPPLGASWTLVSVDCADPDGGTRTDTSG